jgi:protein O-mannosyl-transferase
MSRKKNRRPETRPANQTPVEAVPSPRKSSRWPKTVILCLALLLPALLAYSDSFRAGFTQDNEFIILRNPALQAATSSNVNQILQHTYWWPKEEAGLYRPITTLTYLWNYSVLGNGESPVGYHVVNLFLHFINVLLVYFLAKRFIQGDWLPELIAVAWAVHPVLTESVTNIVGRADILAGVGILAGLLLYLKSTESSGWPRIGYLVGLFAVTTVGVFSKENGVALLGVVILYEITFWKERNNLKAAALACLAIIIPTACMLSQRARLLAAYPPQPVLFLENPLVGAHFFQAKLTAIGIMARYIWKLIWPAALSTDYSYNQIRLASGSLRDCIALAVIAAILVSALILYKRNKTAFFFLTFAFVVFVPTSNLLFNIGTIMAERFLYLPALGFTICLALAIHALSTRRGMRPLTPVAMVLIIAGLGVRTWLRNKDWNDDFTIATASVKAAPESFKTHMALAIAYIKRPLSRDIDASISEWEKCLAILSGVSDDENSIWPYASAGTTYKMEGDQIPTAARNTLGQTGSAEATRAYQRALELFLNAVRIDKNAVARQDAMEILHGTPASQIVPRAAKGLHTQIAQIYLQLGDTDKAYRTALFARALAPESPDNSLLAAQAAISSGRNDEAAEALMVGYLFTQRNAFLPRLDSLYRSGLDPKGCAMSITANGRILNSVCAPVHADICSAYADIIQILQWELKQDVADQTKSVAMGDFGCTAQVLANGKKIQVFP